MLFRQASRERSYLVFQIAGLACAVRVSEVEELTLMAATVPAPGQPSILEGFLNLRGRAVPVVRLRRLFALPPAEPSPNNPLLVVHHGGHRMALLADRVDEVVEIEPSALQAIANSASCNGCAESQFPFDDHGVVVLATQRLLLASERECVDELQAATQRRLDDLKEAADNPGASLA